MRMNQSFFFVAGPLALALALGGTGPVLSAQTLTTGDASPNQVEQGQGSTSLSTEIVLRIREGVSGLAYLFRPSQTPTRNLWQRRQHPELWRSTGREKEAAKAALPLIGALALFGLFAWGGRRLLRARRSPRVSARRERPERRTPAAFAGGR